MITRRFQFGISLTADGSANGANHIIIFCTAGFIVNRDSFLVIVFIKDMGFALFFDKVILCLVIPLLYIFQMVTNRFSDDGSTPAVSANSALKHSLLLRTISCE